MFKKKPLPEGVAAPEEGATAPKSGPRRKIIAILALVVLSVLALGAGLFAQAGRADRREDRKSVV